jgi:hypothetical protein
MSHCNRAGSLEEFALNLEKIKTMEREITDELREFLGFKKDQKVTLMDMIAALKKYMQEKNLFIPQEDFEYEDTGEMIKVPRDPKWSADEPLRKLFRMGESEELGKHNYMKYFSKHFVKK